MPEKLFIIWDEKDGLPRVDEDGNIISDGIIGRVGLNNVYINTYATYHRTVYQKGKPPYNMTPADLEVGEHMLASFSLSGTKGTYQVWRVQ